MQDHRGSGLTPMSFAGPEGDTVKMEQSGWLKVGMQSHIDQLEAAQAVWSAWRCFRRSSRIGQKGTGIFKRARGHSAA